MIIGESERLILRTFKEDDIASVLPENKASENVLKNIGFKFVEMKWFDDSQCFEPYYEYIFDEKISTIKT